MYNTIFATILRKFTKITNTNTFLSTKNKWILLQMILHCSIVFLTIFLRHLLFLSIVIEFYQVVVESMHEYFL